MNTRKNLNIAVLGSTRGTDLQCIISDLESGALPGITLKFVLSNVKDAYILERAKNYNPILVEPQGLSRRAYDGIIMSYLEENEVDLVLLIGWMRLLSKDYVDKWGHKTMNIHPSLLPAFAGGMDLNVHKEVIKRGCKISGATLIFVDEGADTGPIIDQRMVTVDYDMPPESESKEHPKDSISESERRECVLEYRAQKLKEKVQKLEGKMLIDAIRLYRDGNIHVDKDTNLVKITRLTFIYHGHPCGYNDSNDYDFITGLENNKVISCYKAKDLFPDTPVICHYGGERTIHKISDFIKQ